MGLPVLPYIVEKDGSIERYKDVFTKLFESRTIFLSGVVNETAASIIVAQLLYLSSDNSEEDVYLYINSPGGVITAGMAIFDTMNYIKPDVATICIGQAASMGSFLLAAGTKGKRFTLPNAEVMIHQPMGGANGQASDIEIAANHIIRTKKKLTQYLAGFTGQPYEKVKKDCDRDTYMNAEQAKEYGLIDNIITNVSEIEK